MSNSKKLAWTLVSYQIFVGIAVFIDFELLCLSKSRFGGGDWSFAGLAADTFLYILFCIPCFIAIFKSPSILYRIIVVGIFLLTESIAYIAMIVPTMMDYYPVDQLLPLNYRGYLMNLANISLFFGLLLGVFLLAEVTKTKSSSK